MVDENLPVALARWLTAQGHEAQHTSDLGLNSTPDLDIARRASQTDTVIVTKDSDYLSFLPGMQAPRVVHLGVRNASSAQLIEICGGVWPGVMSALQAGETPVKVARNTGRVS